MLSYIEISRENLLHNLSEIRAYIGDKKKIVCVVKANGYGIGMKEVVNCIKRNVDIFAVDDIQELRELRLYTDKKAYVLGYIESTDLEEAVGMNAVPAVYDDEVVHILDEIGKKRGKTVPINLKIDALLGRQGVLPENLPEILEKIKKSKGVVLTGIYAHFANIEEAADTGMVGSVDRVGDVQDVGDENVADNEDVVNIENLAGFSHARKQIKTLDSCIHIAQSAGFAELETHISSTSGILVYDMNNNHHTHVRLGLGLYGLWPSEGLRRKYESRINLKPVCRWITHIAQIKTVPADFSIGYGLTYKTSQQTKIAIIPQGYSDGFSRSLSNTGEILVRGTRCPVLGRVAMNMCVIDVSALPDAKKGDEAVLLGHQGANEITAEHIAAKTGTINYEVIASLSPLLPRVVV